MNVVMCLGGMKSGYPNDSTIPSLNLTIKSDFLSNF